MNIFVAFLGFDVGFCLVVISGWAFLAYTGVGSSFISFLLLVGILAGIALGWYLPYKLTKDEARDEALHLSEKPEGPVA